MSHKNLIQDQLVMVRRLDDTGREYKAKVVGKSISNIIDHYIVELLDPIHGNEWSHCSIPESCLDPI